MVLSCAFIKLTSSKQTLLTSFSPQNHLTSFNFYLQSIPSISILKNTIFSHISWTFHPWLHVLSILWLNPFSLAVIQLELLRPPLSFSFPHAIIWKSRWLIGCWRDIAAKKGRQGLAEQPIGSGHVGRETARRWRVALNLWLKRLQWESWGKSYNRLRYSLILREILPRVLVP